MDQKYSDHADSSNDFQGTGGRHSWSVTDTKLLLSCLEHCVVRCSGYTRWFIKVSEKLQNRHLPVNPDQVMNKWKNMQKKHDPRFAQQIQRIRNLQQEMRSKRMSGEPLDGIDDLPDDKINRWTERNSSLFWEYAENFYPLCKKRSQMWEMIGKKFRAAGKAFTNQQVRDKWLNTSRKPSTSSRINRIMKEAETHFSGGAEHKDWSKQDTDTMLQIFTANLQFLSTLEETEMFNTLSREMDARGVEVSACDVRTQWLQLLKKKDKLPTEDYELVHNIQTHIDRKEKERKAQSNDPLEEDSKQGIAMLMDESEHESETAEETQLLESFANDDDTMEQPEVSRAELLAFLKHREKNQQKRHAEICALKKRQIDLLENILKR